MSHDYYVGGKVYIAEPGWFWVGYHVVDGEVVDSKLTPAEPSYSPLVFDDVAVGNPSDWYGPRSGGDPA